MCPDSTRGSLLSNNVKVDVSELAKRGALCDNYVTQWWVELEDELNWLFTNRLSATRYMKVKRMGITEILRKIWQFSANEIKSSESVNKQPTQLIIAAEIRHNWLILNIQSVTESALLK